MEKPSAFKPARMRRPSVKPGPRYAPMLVRFALSNDALKPNWPATERMAGAMVWTCSSLWMTQGPAIRTSGFPGPKALNSIGTRILGFALDLFLEEVCLPAAAVLKSRADECLEQ